MTEALKIGIEAVNRWIFHGWNYDTTTVAVPDPAYDNKCAKSLTVPRFLAEAKWSCNLPHMIEKLNSACRNKTADAYLVSFYAELDNYNRKALLEWVLQNYTDERKLF